MTTTGIYSGSALIAELQGRVTGYDTAEHRATMSVTQYPVERGGSLTDHAVALPKVVKLTGVVSDLRGHDPQVAWRQLERLQDELRRVTVFTPVRVYRDMLIVKAEAQSDVRSGAGLRVQLELQEVLTAVTQTVRISAGSVSGPGVDRGSEVDGGDRIAYPL